MGDSIRVQRSVREIYLGLTNRPCQLSLAILSWVGAWSKLLAKAWLVMLCGWGLKAPYGSCLVADKTV